MRDIKYIVIHESDTPTGRPVTPQEIDNWHLQRGFKRSREWRDRLNPDLLAFGYHYLIGVAGELWTGRHLEEIPAAVQGYNAVSVNICLAGKGKYTPAQWATLKKLVWELKGKYPAAEVKGHYEFSTARAQGKTCPDFDVPKWYAADMEPEKEHIA